VIRFSLGIGFGLLIAGVNAWLLLKTNPVGAGWVFLIDVGSAAAFALGTGWLWINGEAGVSEPVPAPWETS
jgi:hypothetical protein